MDLAFSEEQRLLRDSVDNYMGRRYDFAFRTETAKSAQGFSDAVWKEMAALGWLALPLPETHGGLGGTTVDTGILAEAFGRGLLLEPYVSTVVLGAGLIAAAGTARQQAEYLPRVVEGNLLLAFAHSEPRSHLDFDKVATRAVRDGDGWKLDGCKGVVMDGPSAGMFIVSARTIAGNDSNGVEGIGLFLVPPGARGVQRTDHLTVDGRRGSRIVLDGVRLASDALLGESHDASGTITAVIDRANAILAADMVGCMQALLEATVAYTKTRVQFGQPIAANQVLKHRMARMAICCEEARSMALFAALKADAPEAERQRAISGAKVKVIDCARYVAEQAVQLHGAIGVTEELNVGAYLKRILAHEAMLGTRAWHLKRHASLREKALAAA